MTRIDNFSIEINKKLNQNSRLNTQIKKEIIRRDADLQKCFEEKLKNFQSQINLLIENNSSIKANLSQISERLISIEQNFSFIQKNNQKEKILLIGYYGEPNMGDEVMLKILLDQIGKLKKDSDVYVMFTNNPQYNYLQWQNIKFINFPKSHADIVKMAEYFDVLIVGGGAHIDDQYFKDKFSYKWHVPAAMIFLSKSFINYNKKTYFLSLSTNDHLVDKKFIEEINFIIDNSTYFSVRDKLSLSELINHGANEKKIRLLDDPVFLLKINQIMITKNKTICINLIDYYNQPVKTIEILTGIYNYITESSLDYKIKIVSFCTNFSNDYNYFCNIINEIGISTINYEIVTNFDTVDDFLEEVTHSDIMVNMRYHGSVLSMICGIPSINIIYDVHPHYSNKMNYLAKLFNMQKYFTNYSTINKDVVKSLLSSVENENDLRNNLIKKSNEIKKQLLKQYANIFA